jgi:hypothetical protein
MGARKITVSTSGLAPQIRRLADEPQQFRLAVSLHGATDETRARIMPINKKYPLKELAAACAYYQEKKGRMITLEYILIAGVNDGLDQAPPLAKLALCLHAKVNLIPYNKVEGLPWERPEEPAQEAFLAALEQRKVPATLRREKGGEIDAACGQLRLKTEREPPYPASMGEWSMALRPYVNLNNNVCLCPLATTFRSSLGNNLWVANNTQNLAWGIMGSNQYPVLNWGAPGLYGSYGINGWMYNPPLSAQPEGSDPLFWRKLSAAGPSHNIPVFSDCDYDGSQPSDTDSPPPSPGYQSVTDDMSNFAIPRHEGGRPVNVAFMDSSVSPAGLKQLWRFKWSTDFDTTYQDKLNQWPVWMRSYQ